ncbi:MAG: LacI family DNA-binding transcriptional regulator [Firmicutes bacterium]|nr:LacI family DNA-binding transcriptional regulator [Bacillota bacterium]
MKQEHITIDVVSQMAGVSKTTVSRYLNQKYEHMSEKTKNKIKSVIEELDYRPNLIARNLKSQKTNLIGVIVSDVTNPVTVQLIKGVIDQCTNEGYQVIIASSDEKVVKEKEYIHSMVDRQVEGLIISIVNYNEFEMLETLSEKGVKIVLADRTINKPVLDMVTTDNYDMTKVVIQSLYNMGFEAVALFSSDLLRSNVRLARYSAFLNQSEMYVPNPSKLVYIFNEDNEEEYKKGLSDFIGRHPGRKVAAFATTPMALLNLLGAARDLDLRIPEDIGVCGYDNLHWTKLIGGGITVVEQPFYEVGVESAKMLIKRIRNQVDDSPKYIELKSKLILRNSTNIGERHNGI